MHHHTIEFRIRKYQEGTNISWQYEAYLNPDYTKKVLSCVGPCDSLDELAKELATRGGKKATYKFMPFTDPKKQVIQINSHGKKYVEPIIDINELDELVNLFYEYKFKKKVNNSQTL